jgi:large subunit ribosomal protein L15
MPLQRRLPKVGFTSRVKKYSSQVILTELDKLDVAEINVQVLIDKNIVPIFCKSVKLINTGVITRTLHIKGINVTEGAKNAIVALGGTVEA